MAFVNGVDVSAFQGAVDWNRVRAAGNEFAFIKATEGAGHVSSTFHANWQQTKNAGMVRGAYHFFRPAEDAKKQAQLFAQTTQLQQDDLPGALDLEVMDGVSNANLLTRAQIWLDTVEQLTGQRPLVYLSPSFGNDHGLSGFGGYPLWVAHYTNNPAPKLPNGWSAWKFWQYSEQGVVPGIKGKCDVNRFNGSLAELIAFATGGQALEPPVMTPPPPATGTPKTYKVRAGDTLGGIAHRHGVTVVALAQRNHITNPNLIHAGQVLVIP